MASGVRPGEPIHRGDVEMENLAPSLPGPQPHRAGAEMGSQHRAAVSTGAFPVGWGLILPNPNALVWLITSLVGPSEK